MSKLFSSSWKVLAVMTGLSLVMRCFSFFPSVIDHDESTYILIADALRHGQVYLRDVMDTKPVGIFLLFAFFQSIFGKSIFVIRLITALWVGITGWMLYRTHTLLATKNSSVDAHAAPVASGIIYIFITSMYTTYGLSPNTEIFFNLFTITALYLILKFQGAVWIFLAGVLLGIGFIIKYVVLADGIALGIYYLWLQIKSGKTWKFWLTRCSLLGIGFLLPFLFVWAYYKQMGLGETFWFYSFKVSGRYIMKPQVMVYVNYVFSCFVSFLPVMVWFFFCLKNWRQTGPGLSLLGSIWGLLVMTVILLPGRMFSHYFIQFMLPLSLVAGSFFDSRRQPGPVFSWMRNPVIGYLILFLLITANVIFQKIDFYDKTDYPREVAAFLKPRLHSGDILYTGDYQQIIYHLTDTKSPTPYIHSSLIWKTENNIALGINQTEEFDKILGQHPRFILIKYPLDQHNPLYIALQSSYAVLKTFDKEVMVYERK